MKSNVRVINFTNGAEVVADVVGGEMVEPFIIQKQHSPSGGVQVVLIPMLNYESPDKSLPMSAGIEGKIFYMYEPGKTMVKQFRDAVQAKSAKRAGIITA
jgi:hypothetical protein